MAEQSFVHSLEDLSGKVAVVTGGSQGIGLQTTIFLGQLGATVYVCALDTEEDRAGVALAKEALKRHQGGSSGSIHFQPLDLSSIEGTLKSVERFKKGTNVACEVITRLDIIIGNAGTAFQTLDELSPEGYERTFAVNCLGHFVFITSLLDLVEQTAKLHGEARITLTSSFGYKAAQKLDYDYLTTKIPGDGTSLLHLGGGFQRYLDSKLAVLYLALELNKRLQRRGLNNIFVNACHPGNVPKTAIGNGQQPLVSPLFEKTIKKCLGLFLRNSVSDAAKTQIVLSASKNIREDEVHGEFWVPIFSWWGSYLRSQKEDITSVLANDEDEWAKLWNFCEEAVNKVQRRS